MILRLVSSGDGPGLAIRDHLLSLVRKHGTLEGPVRYGPGDRAPDGRMGARALDPIQRPVVGGGLLPRGIATPFSGSIPRPTCPTALMSGAPG
jgi:hypothetical protein